MHGATFSVSLYMCWPYCVNKSLIPWCLSYSAALILFLSLLRPNFLIPEGRDFMEISYLELGIPKSLLPCVLSGCGSMYLFSYAAGRDFSDVG